MTEAEQRQASDVDFLTQLICTGSVGVAAWEVGIWPIIVCYLTEDVDL